MGPIFPFGGNFWGDFPPSGLLRSLFPPGGGGFGGSFPPHGGIFWAIFPFPGYFLLLGGFFSPGGGNFGATSGPPRLFLGLLSPFLEHSCTYFSPFQTVFSLGGYFFLRGGHFHASFSLGGEFWGLPPQPIFWGYFTLLWDIPVPLSPLGRGWIWGANTPPRPFLGLFSPRGGVSHYPGGVSRLGGGGCLTHTLTVAVRPGPASPPPNSTSYPPLTPKTPPPEAAAGAGGGLSTTPPRFFFDPPRAGVGGGSPVKNKTTNARGPVCVLPLDSLPAALCAAPSPRCLPEVTPPRGVIAGWGWGSLSSCQSRRSPFYYFFLAGGGFSRPATSAGRRFGGKANG